jgi:hypothetical protein
MTPELVNIGTQKHTRVMAVDDHSFYAHHSYQIEKVPQTPDDPPDILAGIAFQMGPIKENGVNGVHQEDLIAICIHRLEHLNQDRFRCRENSIAITKLEEAMMWLRKRTLDREDRGVEGTHLT